MVSVIKDQMKILVKVIQIIYIFVFDVQVNEKQIEETCFFLFFFLLNKLLLIYKTQFYKHYLQCRSHYDTLLRPSSDAELFMSRT